MRRFSMEVLKGVMKEITYVKTGKTFQIRVEGIELWYFIPSFQDKVFLAVQKNYEGVKSEGSFMKMSKMALLTLVLIPFIGCASIEERCYNDAKEIANGSEVFFKSCVESRRAAAIEASRAWSRAFSNMGQSAPATQFSSPDPIPMPIHNVNCTSSTLGNAVYTNCY